MTLRVELGLVRGYRRVTAPSNRFMTEAFVFLENDLARVGLNVDLATVVEIGRYLFWVHKILLKRLLTER